MDASTALVQALSALEPGKEYVTGIVTNLLSEAIVRGGEQWLQSKNEATKVRLRDGISDAIADALIGSIRAEQNEEARSAIAMTFGDEILLLEFADGFKRNEVEEDKYLDLIKDRVGEARWEASETLIRPALRNLLDRVFLLLRDDEDFCRSFQIRFQQEATRHLENAAPHIAQIPILLEAVLKLQKDVAAKETALGASVTHVRSEVIATEENSFPREAVAKHLQHEFELARTELQTGSVKRAREQFALLVKTLEEIGIPGNETLYFRCRSNLGIATFYVGDIQDAASHLEVAFPYSNNSLKGRTNKALAQTLLGDTEKALETLEEVLVEDVGFFPARLQQADVLNHVGRVEDALVAVALLNPDNDGDRVRTAQMFLSLKKYDKAKEIAADVLSRNGNDANALAVTADSIALPLVQRINEGGLSGRFLTLEERKSLETAVAQYERALPTLRRGDRDENLTRILCNLSAFSAAAALPHKALAFVREAIEIGGSSRDNVCNLYHAMLGVEDYDGAAQAARDLAQWDDPHKALFLELDAMIAAGRIEEALERLTAAVAAEPELAESRDIKNFQVRLYYDLPDVEKATLVLGEMLEAHPEDSLGWLTAAEIARGSREIEREKECLLKAIQFAKKKGLVFHCQSRLGQIFAEQRKWEEALANFVPAESGFLDSPWRINGLVCLFNLDRFEDALNFAESILSEGYDRMACEIAIESCLKGHHLERALKHAALLRQHDDSDGAWTYLAQLHARLGDLGKSKQLISRGLGKNPRDFHLLHLKSGVHHQLAEYDASLSAAFKALEVAEGNQVLLAHRLIVGNALSIPNNVPTTSESVTKVHESIAFLVATNDPSFQQIEFDEELTAFRARLKEQQESASLGISFFSERGMPVYCISRMSGKDIYDVWRGLANGGPLFVRMAIGTHEEQAKEREHAAKYEGVVLDATALFTFAALGRLSTLTRVYSRVVVPFPLYEKLKRIVDDLSVGNETKGTMQLAPDGEHIVLNENVSAYFEEKRRFLSEIVTFIESGAIERCGFFPPNPLNEASDFIESCDSSTFASVCIAKAENLGLLCDDVATRQLSALALGVDSFCSQRVMEVAVDKGIVSKEENFAFVVGLFEHNYAFVSDSPDMLGFYFRRNGWQIDALATRILGRFDSGQMHHISASRIYGTIMAEGWLQSKDSEAWLTYFCKRLSASGDVEENFRWAAIGAMQSLTDVPEVFFAMTMRIRDMAWLDRGARDSFVLAFCAAELVFGKEDAGMASACPKRWRATVQTLRNGDNGRRLIRRTTRTGQD